MTAIGQKGNAIIQAFLGQQAKVQAQQARGMAQAGVISPAVMDKLQAMPHVIAGQEAEPIFKQPPAMRYGIIPPPPPTDDEGQVPTKPPIAMKYGIIMRPPIDQEPVKPPITMKYGIFPAPTFQSSKD